MLKANLPANSNAQWIVRLCLIAIAVILNASCSRTTSATSSSESKEAMAVGVAKTSRRDLSESLVLAAEFRPFQEIDVHAKVAGYVKRIFVDVGDRVKEG